MQLSIPETAAEQALRDWAASGAMALTGRADGPPLPACGAAATAVRRALADLAAHVPGAALPGYEVLGERAALAGLARRAPWSAGGASRILPASDGWVGISLPRDADLEMIPALIERAGNEPWLDLGRWLTITPATTAVERATLLGLAAAAVPVGDEGAAHRPGVVTTIGGPRPDRGRAAPLVVDLSSLWAGPLCAHLLGLTGADVVKVESTTRPDGGRRGNAAFFDLLHGGHRAVALGLDSDEGRAALARLVATADVVIEASRPRALRQLGVVADSAVAAGMIWVSITAYGRAPEAESRIGFGDDVAAGAGLIAWDADTPIPAGDALADPLAGVTAAAAAAHALSSGHGVLLDVSMHDVAREAFDLAPVPAPVGTGLDVRVPHGRHPTGHAPLVGEHTGHILAALPD